MRLALAGRRIVVTRPRAQAAEFCERLAALGARPILCPTIETVPLPESAPPDSVAATLKSCDWIIFTSANGVRVFCARWAPPRHPAPRIAAIGPATARELRRCGLEPALVPEAFVAEGLLEAIGPVAGLRILIPHAAGARPVLAAGLRARGADVIEAAAYRTVAAAPDPEALAELTRGVDAITFTSSSGVRNFAPLRRHLPGRAAVACIGPVTAQAAREAGFEVDMVASPHTVDGLLAALAEYFRRL